MLGRYLFFGGLAIAAIGVIVWGLDALGLRLGRLPGDIALERDGLRVYIPITTMILASLVFSAIAWVIARFR